MKTTNITTLIGTVAVLAALAVLLLLVSSWGADRQIIVTNFEECTAAGNPIMESYPEQCRTPDGHTFVREVDPGLPPIVGNGCAVGGCSGQLCVSAGEASDIVTTCEYRAEYACYREASCEPQADGKCGWTQTVALAQCLANPPVMQ